MEGDKFGGRIISSNRSLLFKECLDRYSMVDMGFAGPRFTWTNRRNICDLIQERIDRFFANPSWLMLELLTSLDVCLTNIARYFLRLILPIVCFCLDPLNSKVFGYQMSLFRELSWRLGAGLALSRNLLKIFLENPRFGTRIILGIFLGKRKGSWLGLTASRMP